MSELAEISAMAARAARAMRRIIAEQKAAERRELARQKSAERRELTRKAKIDAAVTRLRQLGLGRGDVVFTKVLRVGNSGMSRVISCAIRVGDSMMDVSALVADACDMRYSKLDGVCVGGCGMDMGFHLVYCLSYSMFSADGQDAWASDPADRRGGYALQQRWL